MSPFELLKEDHRRVSALFEKISKTTSRAAKARAKLIEELQSELTLHAQLEEEVFYPALRGKLEEEVLLLEAYEEHAIVKRLLVEIDFLDTTDERWSAKVKVLSEYVKHHVKEEEGELFEQARAALDTTDLRDLGDEMLEAKELAKGSALPRRRSAAERETTPRRAKTIERALAARSGRRPEKSEEKPLELM